MSGIRLNIEVIDELRDLLADGFPMLIDRFTSDVNKRLETMAPAIESRDFDVIHHEAHGVKGSCRNIGAEALADICADLESRGRESSDDNIEQLFAAAQQEFAALHQELSALD